MFYIHLQFVKGYGLLLNEQTNKKHELSSIKSFLSFQIGSAAASQ